ncbi:MAG: PfkB family carbohydrate kinase [Chloroflexi bacterium]|nr:PfkB family carbohydrate kinase [Chloroflexota bacterium]MCY3581399.1 PfkB family carbohydrate kinase [Chloroflexota bacterium]MCY3717544.1 PfkB family carbohydrate kinase [Chloroflexota bacterium]MDE2651947.1 PfkB family carbohydrate kinase [Chloroflexota bacterium]
MPAAEFLAVGSIIIDDIVYPDGRTSMGVLGGGGTHAAYGMLAAGEKPALVGLVGEDLPADVRARLNADFDTSGLAWTAHKQVRGWQIFEWDGRRNEVFRVDVIEPFMHQPDADSPDLPFRSAASISLLRQPDYVAGWRRRFPAATLLWEPTRAFMLSGDYARFLRGLRQADIVSPNLHEARAMTGLQDELAIARRLLADGAAMLALRMGELGSLVARRDENCAWRIPALPVREVIDQTGAGNSYCGGFVVGWQREQDIAAAGCYGAAAASFTLEHIGCAHLPADIKSQFAQRLQQARAGAVMVNLR